MSNINIAIPSIDQISTSYTYTSDKTSKNKVPPLNIKKGSSHKSHKTQNIKLKEKKFKLSKFHLFAYIFSGLCDLIIGLKILLAQYEINKKGLTFTLDFITLVLTTINSVFNIIEDKDESTKIKLKAKYKSKNVQQTNNIHIRNTSMSLTPDIIRPEVEKNKTFGSISPGPNVYPLAESPRLNKPIIKNSKEELIHNLETIIPALNISREDTTTHVQSSDTTPRVPTKIAQENNIDEILKFNKTITDEQFKTNSSQK